MVHAYGTVLRTAESRFVEKTKRLPNGCIVWTAGTASQSGYGYFFAGRSGPHEHGRVYAHRWAYEHYVGPIPAGLHIDHLCRNRLCVNPTHLEPVTPRENVHRSHGNVNKTHCVHGHEFTPENTYIAPGRNYRSCVTCRRRHSEKSKERRRNGHC